MSSTPLDNLVRIGRPAEVPDSPELARRILTHGRVKLRDAGVRANSAETRFECAYAAMRDAADVGLLIAGYRTPSNHPGHHPTAIQALVHTLRIDPEVVRVLDALRKQRNLADYEGEPVTEAALEECMRRSVELLERAEDALRARCW